jgi:hypothetical protein
MISTSNLLTRYTEKPLFIFIEHIDIAQPTSKELEPNRMLPFAKPAASFHLRLLRPVIFATTAPPPPARPHTHPLPRCAMTSSSSTSSSRKVPNPNPHLTFLGPPRSMFAARVLSRSRCRFGLSFFRLWRLLVLMCVFV